jgi:hypothetical protein
MRASFVGMPQVSTLSNLPMTSKTGKGQFANQDKYDTMVNRFLDKFITGLILWINFIFQEVNSIFPQEKTFELRFSSA